MIALLLLAAAQNPYVDTMMAAKQTYADCMRTTVLRLGGRNSEPGDTVVAAARAECRPALQRFASLMPEAALDPMADATQLQSVRAVQSDVEGEAMAALLEARHRP